MKYAIILTLFTILFACKSELKEITKYHKNGKISERIFVDKNKKVQGKAVRYFENGKIQKIYSIKNDKLNGYCFNFFENGKLETKSKFLNNIQIDSTFNFNKLGKLVAIAIYDKEGKNLKDSYFHSNGKKSKEYNYIIGTDVVCSSRYFDKMANLLVSDIYTPNTSHFVKMNLNKEVIHFNLNGTFCPKPDSIILNVVKNYDLLKGEPKSKRKITYLDHKKLFYKPTDSDYTNDKLFIILEEYCKIDGYSNKSKFYVQLLKGQKLPKDNLYPMYIR